MIRFGNSVLIERPIEEVWAYVDDMRNNPRWQGPIIDVTTGAEPPLRVGTSVVEVVSFLGKRFELTLVVTERDPMKRSSVRTVSGPVRLDGSYAFEPVDGGTRFTTEAEVEAHGFFKVAEPAFARIARREWESSCATLKELLEAQATMAP